VGVFEVVAIVDNNELTIAPAPSIMAAGNVFLVTSEHATPFEAQDSTAVTVYTTWTAPIAADTAVSVLRPAGGPMQWWPVLSSAPLRRRLGFLDTPRRATAWQAVHDASRTWDLGTTPYVLVCLRLPQRGNTMHQYLTGDGDGTYDTNEVVLGKIVLGGGASMVREQQMSVNWSSYGTLSHLNVRIRNPDMTLFDTGMLENSMTVAVVCNTVDDAFLPSNNIATSRSLYY
jgi:hypothetical protein